MFLTVKPVLESARWEVDKKRERVSWVKEYREEDGGRVRGRGEVKVREDHAPPFPSPR